MLPGMIAHPDIHPLRVPCTEGNSKLLTFPRSCSHSPLVRQLTGNRKSRWLFQARDHWARPPLRLTSPPSAEQRLARRCTFKQQSEPARPGGVGTWKQGHRLILHTRGIRQNLSFKWWNETQGRVRQVTEVDWGLTWTGILITRAVR